MEAQRQEAAQRIDTIRQETWEAITATLARAARSIYQAANSTGYTPERREELLKQYSDQCSEIARRTGRSAQQIEEELKK